MLVLCSSWKERIISRQISFDRIPPCYIEYENIVLHVKVSSQFRKAFLNYSGNIFTLKVEVLGKKCELFRKRESRIILAVLVCRQQVKLILLKSTQSSAIYFFNDLRSSWYDAKLFAVESFLLLSMSDINTNMCLLFLFQQKIQLKWNKY